MKKMVAPDQDTLFSPPSTFMQNLVGSNPSNLPSSCDEEQVEGGMAADEPPDDVFHLSRFHPFSDGEFSKHLFHPVPKESLLTRALLTSPRIGPVDHMRVGIVPNLEQGMSASSVWSNASTAELTSDSMTTNPSRTNSPSPPSHFFLSAITAGVLHGERKNDSGVPQVETAFDRKVDGKQPRISFACGTGRRSLADGEQASFCTTAAAQQFEKKSIEPARPKPSSGLTFVCSQQQRQQGLVPTNRRPKSPAPLAKVVNRWESDITIKAGTNNTLSNGRSPSDQFSDVPIPEPRSIYDSESVVESWTNQPIDKTRLLRVDDVLRKERDIRKLGEEVEREALQEEGDDGDDILNSVEDDDDEEEEEQDELDIDEDEDNDCNDQSGNETDNEEGFASGDESDDDWFFGIHPPMTYNIPIQSISPSHDTSDVIFSLTKGGSSPCRIRSPTPELPDSTDFVCGTFDEDQPLEQAYLSCLEERKRSKHKTTPQDIDPSFPDSEPEESDNESPTTRPAPKGKLHMDGGSESDCRTSRAEPRSPRGRIHSPAPVASRRVKNPAPTHSRHTSPVPPSTRRGSRVLSPAPTRVGRRTHFQAGRNIVRTRSLPRYPGGTRRAAKSSCVPSGAASPHRQATRPMLIRRGAIDIVKGLEKKRERRKARLGRNKPQEGSWKAGEGVEKMRLLGLEICGKGRSKQGIWMMSA